MKKALFFDIDGTLVNFQGRMPDSAKQALRQVQKNGHQIVLCSGRSVCQIYPWLLDMKFDGIIGAAGAYVAYGNQIIYEHHMERNALTAAIALLERVGAYYSAQSRNGIIVTEDSKERMQNRFRSRELPEDMVAYIWRNIKVDEQLKQRHDIEKLNFFQSQMSVRKIREQLSEYCDVTTMSFEHPTDEDGEISSKGINKALGIRKYIEYVGIAREDTIAFGDGANDFDMLEYAQVGVAMGNAIDTLKERADYVTTGIDENGIEHALQKYGLL